MDQTGSSRETIVEFQDLKKKFGGVEALKGVSFSISKGEIRGLVGENGAGKSTLIKICAGMFRPTSGNVVFMGDEIREWHPDFAEDLGIMVVHQEVSHALFLNMTIADNIFLGPNPPKTGAFNFIDRKYMNRAASEFMSSLGINLNPKKEVGRCPADQRQLILIAKALYAKAKLVIMDEPTTSLSRDEVEILFNVIRNARQQGTTFLFVSHRLNEILEICQNITVLRNGVYIDTYPKTVPTDHLVKSMIGRTTKESTRVARAGKDAPVTLEVKGLSSKSAGICDITFTLKKGEILGLIGLQGSGRSEILMTIFGLLKKDSGNINIDGKPVKIRNSNDAIKAGLGFISEERKTALFYDHNVAFNINACIFDNLSKFGFVNAADYNKTAVQYIEDLRIRTPNTKTSIFLLSGGNQQKALISRWLATNTKILFCDEPTKGVDVGSKVEIRNKLRALADSGYSIIFVSSDFDEVLSVSDRLLLINSGRIAETADPKDTDSYELLNEITRLHRVGFGCTKESVSLEEGGSNGERE